MLAKAVELDSTTLTEAQNNLKISLLGKCSYIRKLERIIAYILRFIKKNNKIKIKNKSFPTYFKANELKVANAFITSSRKFSLVQRYNV